MERLRLERGYFRTAAGKPVYLIGANVWPKSTGPFMYRLPWDPMAIGRDLSELAALGANAARIFCFWPDFMPTADAVNADALDRLAQTIDLCARHGMWAIPTLFVGHMSGENWAPAWARGDWFSDETLLRAQELFAHTVCARYNDDPRIAAWLLTNEWPLFAGQTDREHGIAWARRVCDAVRSADPSHAVSLGDGAWDLVWGQDNGLPARRLAEIVDFFGPHFYPKQADPLRESLVASFSMRMAQALGRPVVLEEFGCSSDQASDRNAADYYRTTLWSAFGAGNCATLVWNSHDFDELADRRPYSHHPYELHFGILRADGSPKPQAAEFSRFARFVARHDADEWRPVAPRVAIGRTSYFLESFPFDWGWTKAELRDLYLQTYALCALAGFDARFADLSAPADAELLIVPCLQQLTTGDADRLETFAQAGGTVYVSHGGEPWHPDLGQFIGATPLIEYGLVNAPSDEVLGLSMRSDFGDLHPGDATGVPVRGDKNRAAWLRVTPTQARVLAEDASHRPALLERSAGRGHVVFCAYPIEYYAMLGASDDPQGDARGLYRALALARSTMKPADFAPPSVQCFRWRHHTDATRVRIVAINHGTEDANLPLGDTSDLVDAETNEKIGDGADPFALAGKAVRVVDGRLAGERA